MVRTTRYPWPPTVRQWLVFMAPLAIILAYILVASYKIRFPGIQYDEALYLNAALGGVDKITFITKTFHGFPVLLMPYIGALKAYVFFPVFALFGVSPLTMRLPDIFLSGAALYVLFLLLRVQVGRRLGLLILAVTALDASYIMFTRLDNGPVVLDFLLKVLGLAALLRFVRNWRLMWLVGFWAFMLLGIFNKLNFIWYVNAFAAAFALVYGKLFWQQSSRADRLRLLFVSGLGYLLCVAYYLYISVSYHLGGNFGFVGWQTVYNNLSAVLDGGWFYNYALSAAKTGTSAVFWLLVIVILTGTASLIYLGRRQGATRPGLSRFYAFTGLALTLLLAQVVMTLKAMAGWHYFSVYPFVGILFVLSLEFIGAVLFAKKKQLLVAVSAVGVGLFCVYQLAVYHQYTRIYGHPVSNFIWSSANYSLIDFAKAHRHGRFVSLDWGSQTQFIGFDPVPGKYYEVFGPIQLGNPAETNQDFQKYIANVPGAYYVTHAPGKRVFPEVTSDFFKLARQHGYRPVRTDTIDDGQTPIFEIYRLEH